jgi:hypothetical protein
LTNGMVRLTWAASAGGMVLLQSSELTSTNWTTVPGTPTQVGQTLQVQLSASQGANYYKLAAGGSPPDCPNGDFADGTLNHWAPATMEFSRFFWTTFGKWKPGAAYLRQTVLPSPIWPFNHSAYDEDIGDSIMPITYQAPHSVLLGSAYQYEVKSRLDYTFTVDQNTSLFTFAAAFVESVGVEQPGQEPYLEYYLFPTAQGDHWWTRVGYFEKTASSSDLFFTKGLTYDISGYGDRMTYHNWDCYSVNLSSHIGQQMTARYIVSNDKWGGFVAYMYLDNLCEPADDTLNVQFTMMPEACISGPITADGSASVGATRYFWSIEESDQYGGRNPNTEVYQWFLNSQPGVMDLKSLYGSLGGHFKCDTYYRIKLAVANGCVGWKESVQLLHIHCPDMNPGPNQFVCSDSSTNHQVQLGTPGLPGYTYAWSPSTGLNNAHLAQPLATVIDNHSGCYHSIQYTLTATDTTGCSLSSNVSISILYPLSVSIHDSSFGCGNTHNLSAMNSCGGYTFPPQTTFLWTPSGQTTQAMNVRSSSSNNTLYSVTATTPCGSYTGYYSLPPDAVVGAINPSDYYHPNAMDLSSGNPLDSHYILFYNGQDCGTPGAYNATQWQFQVFNRDGNKFVDMGGSGNGFNNCSIPYWDGTITHTFVYPWWEFWEHLPNLYEGQKVPPDVYVTVLYLKNCYSPYWVLVVKDNVTVF